MSQDSENSDNIWFEEIHRENVGLKFKIKDHIFSQQSEFQKVDIFESMGHGKVLTHDGLVMVTERDEHILSRHDYPCADAPPS